MKPLEQKSCSVCHESFGCGTEEGEESCWCARLPHVPRLANAGLDCLCPQCLRKAIQLKSGASSEAKSASSSLTDKLVEGEDYYLEGAAMVFTARYHLRRGYCCDNDCRHCPFRELN